MTELTYNATGDNAYDVLLGAHRIGSVRKRGGVWQAFGLAGTWVGGTGSMSESAEKVRAAFEEQGEVRFE